VRGNIAVGQKNGRQWAGGSDKGCGGGGKKGKREGGGKRGEGKKRARAVRLPAACDKTSSEGKMKRRFREGVNSRQRDERKMQPKRRKVAHWLNVIGKKEDPQFPLNVLCFPNEQKEYDQKP